VMELLAERRFCFFVALTSRGRFIQAAEGNEDFSLVNRHCVYIRS
jgi:hypothetical protein